MKISSSKIIICYLTPLVGSFALMGADISWNTYLETVLEVTVDHWAFSVQSQHLTNQNFNDFEV